MAARSQTVAAPVGSIASMNPFFALGSDDSSDDDTAGTVTGNVTNAATAKSSSATTAPEAQQHGMRPQQRQKLRKQQGQEIVPQDANSRPARGTGRPDRGGYGEQYDASPDNYQGSNPRSFQRRDFNDNTYNRNAYQNDGTFGRDEQIGEDWRGSANRSPRGRGTGRGRGGRGGRGGGGGGADGAGGGRREFDRHVSGTDRPRGMKREGQGKFNWGKGVDDPQTNEAPPVNLDSQGDWGAFDFNDSPAADTAAVGTAPDNATDNNTKQAENVRPEPDTQSYEDYQQQMAAKRAVMKERMPAMSSDIRNGMQQSLQELEREGYKQHVKDVNEDPKRKEQRNYRRMPEPRSVEVPADSFGGGRDRRPAYGERSSRGRDGRDTRDKPVTQKQPTTRIVSNLNLGDSGAFPSL